MVLVPAGEFQSGENKTRVHVDAFYIDKTEVTNAAYAAFCAATGHPLPPEFPKSSPGLPVVNVTFADAQAFATWAEKRLPRDAEWEKAARGEDGRRFPWGDQADRKRANVAPARGRPAKLRPADSFAQGASPYGALQMVGNVWELVDQSVVPSEGILARFSSLKPRATAQEPWYRMRGQSSGEELLPTVIWDGASVPGRWADQYVGFRCAKDPGTH
jgi:serine/threonine-protein kinase